MSYFPDISWSTRVSNVTYHSPYRFTVLAEPLDPNDKGFGVVEVGDWLIDNAGYPFLIENVSGYVLRCYDVNERGNGTLSAYAPYDGRLAYVYRPKNGAFMLTQAQLRKLDKSAPDIINPIEKGVIWAYRGLEIGGEYDGVSGANDNITRINFTDFFPLSTEDEGWQGGKAYTLDLDVTKIDHDLLFNISGAGTIHLDQDQVDALWVKDGANIFRNSDVGVGGSPLDKFHVTTGHSRFNSLTSAVTGVVRANTDGRIAKIDYENDVNKFLASDGLWRNIVTSSGDFLDSVIGMQEDATLSPTLVAGARYIILDAANLHADFGTITGVANNDIVEYNGTDWVVVFDASEALQPATVTVGTDVNNNNNHQWTYNVSTATWVDRGAVADHNSLTGLQGGINGQKYHFSEQQHTDLLEVIGGGDISDTYHSHDARYVEVAGDTMTGDLSVNANFTTTGLTTLNTSLGGVAYLTEGVIGAVDFSDLAYFPSDEGLQGYWSFDEPAGTLAYDQSGNANNGTLVGGVTRVAGKVGNAIRLDGTGYVEHGAISFADNTPYSYSVWIKWVGAPPNNFVLPFGDVGSANNTIYLANSDGDSTFRYRTDANYTIALPEVMPDIFDGLYHHLVWTVDGARKVTVYVDNIAVNSVTIEGSSEFIYSGIGFGHSGSLYFWEGDIDEPRIYSRALTQAEITALYTQKVAKNKDYFHEQMKIGTTAITSGYILDVDGSAQVTGLKVGTLGGILKATDGTVAGGGAFLDLEDTPSTYTANKYLKVNAGANALEFVDEPTGGGSPGGESKSIQYNNAGSFEGYGLFESGYQNILVTGSNTPFIQGTATDPKIMIGTARGTGSGHRFEAGAYSIVIGFTNVSTSQSWGKALGTKSFIIGGFNHNGIGSSSTNCGILGGEQCGIGYSVGGTTFPMTNTFMINCSTKVPSFTTGTNRITYIGIDSTNAINGAACQASDDYLTITNNLQLIGKNTNTGEKYIDFYGPGPAASYGTFKIDGVEKARLASSFFRLENTLQIKDGITAPSAVTGYTQIYVDTEDGDLKVKFGDGTVKTIATNP